MKILPCQDFAGSVIDLSYSHIQKESNDDNRSKWCVSKKVASTKILAL